LLQRDAILKVRATLKAKARWVESSLDDLFASGVRSAAIDGSAPLKVAKIATILTR